MMDPHTLLAEHGIDTARSLARNKHEHACINAAAAMREASTTSPEPAWASMMVTALPHRQPMKGGKPALHWQRQIGFDRYHIDSGHFDDGTPVGIPYGAKGRLVLIGTHTRILKQCSAMPDVPHSRNAYLKELGMTGGGMTYKRVTDQGRRVASCTLTIVREDQSRLTTPLVDFFIYDSGIFPPSTRDIESLGHSRQIIVSPMFYELVLAENIKLNWRALRIISDNSWAIDLYIWFAGTLPDLTESQLLTWKALEFGSGVNYRRSRQTREVFLKTLQLVKAIYPEARVDVVEEGFVLHPSPPPIPSQTSQDYPT